MFTFDIAEFTMGKTTPRSRIADEFFHERFDKQDEALNCPTLTSQKKVRNSRLLWWAAQQPSRYLRGNGCKVSPRDTMVKAALTCPQKTFEEQGTPVHYHVFTT